MSQAWETAPGREEMYNLYRPLNSSRKEIRLLRILPDTSVDDALPETKGPIRCIMHHEFLDESSMRYHALSYAWQDPGLGESFIHPDIPDIVLPIDEFIFLNSQHVKVSRNLWVALWHFRYIAQSYFENPNAHDLKLGDWQRLVGTEKWLVHLHTSLWVDALCINQTDDEERAHQVSIMGEVYKRAECVHAWLGLSTEETAGAMVLMKDLQAMIDPRKLAELLGDDDMHQHMPRSDDDDESSNSIFDTQQIDLGKDKAREEDSGDHGSENEDLERGHSKFHGINFEDGGSEQEDPEDGDHENEDHDDEDHDDEDHKDEEHEDKSAGYYPPTRQIMRQIMEEFVKYDQNRERWIALFELYNREYWKRLWIIQEYLLGTRTLIHVGQCVVDAWIFSKIDFEIVCFCMAEPLLKTTAVSEYYRITSEKKRVFNSFKVSTSKLRPGPDRQPDQLLDLLGTVRNQICSRPHDIIYGVLGLCGAETQANITVNYSLELDQLFKQATSYIIESSKSLEVLFENAAKDNCTCCKGLDQLPNLPSWVPDWRCRGDIPGLGVIAISAASGSREAIARVCPLEATLMCEGLLLGSIQILQSPIPADAKTARSIAESLVKFIFNVLDCQALPHSGQNLHKYIDMVYHIVVKLHRDYESYVSENDFLALLMYSYDSSAFSDIIGELFRDRDVESTIDALGQLLSETNLFTTALLPTAPAEPLGNLGPLELGNCYPFCREGDIITILYGCRKPIALRPDVNAPGQFKVVGQVYLPSYSHGEALGKFEEREFVLS